MTGSTRSAQRVSVDIDGAIKGGVRHAVKVLDLSMTGCLVRGPSHHPTGAILDLDVALTRGVALHTKVYVVDASLDGAAMESGERAYLTGLRFLALAPQDAEALRRFLDQEDRRRRCAHSPAP